MTKPTREQENKIKCHTCKKYFDEVTIFSKNYTEDYDNERWYCQNCFNRACFKQGQEQTLKKELEFLYLLDAYSGLPPLVRILIRNKADKIEGEKGK